MTAMSSLTMVRVVLAGIRAHKARTILAGLAVMIGTGFLGGTLIYGDTATAAFFADLARSGVGVDVVARPVKDVVAGQRALDSVASLTDVAHVDGRVVAPLAMLDRNGRAVTNGGSVGYAVSLPSWPGFSRFRLVDGRLPGRAGEAALDRPTAERQRIGVGDTITVLRPDQTPHQLTVVGIADYGITPQFVDTSVLAVTDVDLSGLTEREGYLEIVAAARPGADPALLRQRVAEVLGPQFQVHTGDELRHELAVDSAKYAEGFRSTLLVSALVALVVACLVGYNTLRILIAQRTRELALLRCVGASRRQVAIVVLGESLVIGMIASLGGVILGVVLAQALLIGQDLDNDLPDYALVVPRSAVIVPLVLGPVMTVLCGSLPALLASRVPPLAALQASTAPWPVHERRARGPAPRVGAALLLTGAAVAMTRTGHGQGFAGLTSMVGGAMAVFVAIVLVIPLFVIPVTSLLGWLPGRIFGLPGRMAGTSARRNPIRFAATITAVMVGVAPPTMGAVVLATANAQSQAELAENFAIDYVVEQAGTTGPARLPDPLVGRLRTAPQFGAVTLTRVASGQVNGHDAELSAVEPGALGTRIEPELLQGGWPAMRPAAVALQGAFAAAANLRIGDRVEVGAWGEPWPATVVAIFDDTPTQGVALVDWSDFAAHLDGDDRLLIRIADETSVADAAMAIDAATAGDPLVMVTSIAERRASITGALNRQLIKLGALLGAALIIAILGIGNTLSLSVLERTRELATLRALGLAVRQMRAMLLIEAVLMTLVGALLGVSFGIGFAWLAASDLIDAYGHGVPEVPVRQIAGYLALAALAGAVASILPAHQATRASIVEAMADT